MGKPVAGGALVGGRAVASDVAVLIAVVATLATTTRAATSTATSTTAPTSSRHVPIHHASLGTFACEVARLATVVARLVAHHGSAAAHVTIASHPTTAAAPGWTWILRAVTLHVPGLAARVAGA